MGVQAELLVLGAAFDPLKAVPAPDPSFVGTFIMWLLFLVPAIVTLILCALLRTPWKLVASLFLLVPLAAALTAAALISKGFGMFWADFCKAVVGIYLFAVLYLGFFPPLIGTIVQYLLRGSSVATRLGRPMLIGSGAALGGLGGLITLAILAFSGYRPEPAPALNLLQFETIWGLVGFFAGAVSGVLIALSLAAPAAIRQSPLGFQEHDSSSA